MRLSCPLLALSLAVTLLASALPARAAERNDIAFDARLRGLTVGAMRLSIRQDGTAYAISALIEDAGVVSLLRSIRYRGSARGALRVGLPVPERFEEEADTGRRQSRAVLDYRGGVPEVTNYVSPNPPGPDSPDPASQGGTLDPATALYTLFRDQPTATACGRTLHIYDGMRRSHVVLGQPRREEGLIRCTGEYRRLQGFTEKELSRNVAFPLELTLTPAGGGLVRVVQARVTSSYGLVTLDRR